MDDDVECILSSAWVVRPSLNCSDCSQLLFSLQVFGIERQRRIPAWTTFVDVLNVFLFVVFRMPFFFLIDADSTGRRPL
jgi:hypothetical protein